MPTYIYKSLASGEVFEIKQKIQEPALTKHPQTQEPMQRVIQAPAIHVQGLKRSTAVNKLSPAATACGCASNAALAQQMYANSRNTPVYGSASASAKKRVKDVKPKASAHGHSHGHGVCCGHGH